MGSTQEQDALLEAFLQPMQMDTETCHHLSREFLKTFLQLSAESLTQFLPTPISESILRPVADHGRGRHLAIDIGGTNLRVGFVELLTQEADCSGTGDCNKTNGVHGVKNAHSTLSNGTNGHPPATSSSPRRLQRHLERPWRIPDDLKDNADGLFLWIAKCIAEVVEEGCRTLDLASDAPLPLGIAFSFPVEQPALNTAIITSMGKGFTIPSKVDLGARLTAAYEKQRGAHLPPIYIAAIANDSVSTLVSFIFSYAQVPQRRATMGLILGTGSNATIPIRLSLLHRSKRPRNVNVLPGESMDNTRIAVNTEWSINGTAPPMRQLGLITPWDEKLSAQNEMPGFQPLEYMTAGRYLGELGRLMLLDYMTTRLHVPQASLPEKIRTQDGLTTTFLSHFKPREPTALLLMLRREFGESPDLGFAWTAHHAEALHRIAKSIQVRAAGLIAAAIVALLTLGDEVPDEGQCTPMTDSGSSIRELGVGYTGNCIVHFQDYLRDCQDFIDELMRKRLGTNAQLRVVLSPCHDGGITGAGILAAAAVSSQTWQTVGGQ